MGRLSLMTAQAEPSRLRPPSAILTLFVQHEKCASVQCPLKLAKAIGNEV